MELLLFLAIIVAFVAGLVVFVALIGVWSLQVAWPVLCALAICIGLRRVLGRVLLHHGEVVGRASRLRHWTMRTAPLRPFERLWNALVESAIDTTRAFCLGLKVLTGVVLFLAILSPASELVLAAEKAVMLLRASLDGIGLGALAASYLAACLLGVLNRALRVKRLLDKVLTPLVAATSFTLFAANVAPSDEAVQAAVVRQALEQAEVANRIDLFADELLREWVGGADDSTRTTLKHAVVEGKEDRRLQKKMASAIAHQIEIPKPTTRRASRSAPRPNSPSAPAASASTTPPANGKAVKSALTELFAEALDLHDEGLHQSVRELLSNLKSDLIERCVHVWSRSLRAATLVLVLESAEIHPSSEICAPRASVRAQAPEYPRFASEVGPLKRIGRFADWIKPAVKVFEPKPRGH
jgi:hypothetical protein